MRHFNTFGPCNPEEHYTVLREALITQRMDKVKKGRFFTIFAPRQAGKTTYFQLLRRELRKEGTYTPILVSFENLTTLSREEFYEALNHKIHQKLATYKIKSSFRIKKPVFCGAFF